MSGEPTIKTFTPIFSTDLETFSLDVGPGFPINPDQGYIREFAYGVPYGFDTMELMLASTMAYSGDNNLIIVEGQRVFVDGRWFRVAPSGATDFDYQATGAASNRAKLYAEEKERIIIALAQSQGRGNENSTGGDQSVLQGVMFWNNDISLSNGGHQEASYITPGNEWVTARFGTAPMNIVANDSGWANNIYLQMAKSLKNDHGVKRIYIYSIAVGGTDLENFILPATLSANGWTLTADKNLTSILYGANGIRAAIDAIPGRSGAIADAVILVHGGANAIEMPEIQARKMKAVFDDLVSEGLANADRTPFLTSMLTTYGDRAYDVSRHLTALRALQWTMPTARIVETVGISTTDGLHFTGDAMSEWGNRAAAALFASPEVHDIEATAPLGLSVSDGLLSFTDRATVMASSPARSPWKPTLDWPNIGIADGVFAGWVFTVPAATATQVLVRRKTWRALVKTKLVLDFMTSSVGSVHMDFRLYCWDADMALLGETVVNFNDAALISSAGNIKYLRATIYPEELGALIPNGDNKACLPSGTEYFTWGIGAGSASAAETRFLPRDMGEQFVPMTDDEVSGFGPVTTNTLTIASGSIKPTSRFHRVDTEAAAASDTVTDIDLSDVPEGASVTLQSVQAVRKVTFEHDTGNIRCGYDRTLNNPMDSITFTKRIFGGVAYASMTAFADNQGAGSGAPTVYSFASRADFIAAIAWPWESGAVVSDGTVQYKYVAPATMIADIPGWVPFGDIYPDHFGANLTPGTTNMAAAIQAAADYAQSVLADLRFFEATNYRHNTPLNFSTGNHRWVCDSGIGNQGVKLVYYGPADQIAVHFSAVDPLLSTATLLNNFYLKGIVFWRPSAGSLAPMVRFTKCQNVFIDDSAAWGGFYGWDFVACRNVRCFRLGGSAAGVFAGGAGSALVRVTSVTHSDDGQNFKNYTHFFGSSLMGSVQYDSTYLIEDADFTTISDSYHGAAQRRVLVKPNSAAARIFNVEINGSYFDGGEWPSASVGEAHIKIDNAAAGRVGFVRVNGGIIAQSEYGILIENPEGVETVTCHGVDFHNSLYNFVRSIGTSTTLDLRIMGGNMTYAARTAAATGDDEYAVCVESFKSVAINGVVASTYAAETQPLFKFGSGDTLQLIGNTATGVTTPVTVTGTVGKRVEIGNLCDVSWPDIDATETGTTPNSDLKFGGTIITASGGTYAARGMSWFREGNFVTVIGVIGLSAKGAATGNASITLPVAPRALSINQVGACMVQGMAADALVPSYVCLLPASGTELQLRKMTTTGAPSGQIVTDAGFGATATINFSIRYRVA